MKRLECRSTFVSKNNTVSGYAAVFDSPFTSPNCTEVIRRGAFLRSLKENPNILALYNHNDDALLGTTRAGTLRLREDDKGLAFDLDLPDTTAGHDALELVRRGDIQGCSFGFYSREERNANGMRELLDVDLVEITLTPKPAYKATNVNLRNDNRKRWLETC